MRLLRWMRSRFSAFYPELPAMLPTCCVYYSPARILIAAFHRDVRGWTTLGSPRALLPFDAAASAIGNAALASLAGFRDGLTEEESASDLSSTFEAVGVRNWESLESEYEPIYILQNVDHVTVKQQRRFESGGFGDAATYKCRPAADELGQVLRRIIDAGRLPMAADADELDIGSEHPASDVDSVDALEPAEGSLDIGNHVVDSFGNRGIVAKIDPEAGHGLGTVTVRFDDHQVKEFALVASGLTRVES